MLRYGSRSCVRVDGDDDARDRRITDTIERAVIVQIAGDAEP